MFEIYIPIFISRLPRAMILVEYFKGPFTGLGPPKILIICLFNYEFILLKTLVFSKVFQSHILH